MPKPRTDLSLVELQGHPGNSKRSAAKERQLPVESEADASEVEALSRLIGQLMEECKRGSRIGKKANPAIKGLGDLIRARELLISRRRPGKKTGASVLRSVDALLA